MYFYISSVFFVVLTVNEILGAAAKERSAESPSIAEDGKNSKGLPTCTLKYQQARPDFTWLQDFSMFYLSFFYFKSTVVFLFPAPSVQQRSQIEELRKFGKEFRVRAQLSLFGDVQIPDQSRGSVLWQYYL